MWRILEEEAAQLPACPACPAACTTLLSAEDVPATLSHQEGLVTRLLATLVRAASVILCWLSA